MKMRSLPTLACIGLAAALMAGAALAQPVSGMTSGEVKKIDKTQMKITVKHEEIKSMDMPPMTMVFQVSDTKLLDTVRVGDKVLFQAEKRDGSMVITNLQTAATVAK